MREKLKKIFAILAGEHFIQFRNQKSRWDLIVPTLQKNDQISLTTSCSAQSEGYAVRDARKTLQF